MSNIFKQSLICLALSSVILFSCQDNFDENFSDAEGSAAAVGEACGCGDPQNRPVKLVSAPAPNFGEFEISADETWSCDTIYRLRGNIRVRNSATLTIEPGTIIRGVSPTDFVAQRNRIGFLVIENDGAIQANGTCDCPIVMTSDKLPGFRDNGDWGGLVLAGKGDIETSAGFGAGITNDIEGFLPEETEVLYGNDGAADLAPNSSLSFLRIEFSGVDISGGGGDETNGLTMGGLDNSKYDIDHVQVSFGGDDGFEWFGGDVDASYLFSYKTSDDDFDTDQAFSGNVQYGAAVRGGQIGNSSGANGFESDGILNGCTASGLTSAKFSNFTVIGSINPTVGFESGFKMREGSNIEIQNSLAAIWPTAYIINDRPTMLAWNQKADRALNGRLVQSSLIGKSVFSAGGCDKDDLGFFVPFTDNRVSQLFNEGNNDKRQRNGALQQVQMISLDGSVGFIRGSGRPNKSPDIVPDLGIATTPEGFFDDALIVDTEYGGLPAFFNSENYRGAFDPANGDTGAGQWCSDLENDLPGWMEFRPESANYGN